MAKTSVFELYLMGKSNLGHVFTKEELNAQKAAKKMTGHFNGMTTSVGSHLATLGGKFQSMDIVGAGALISLGDGLKGFEAKTIHMKGVVKDATKAAALGFLGLGAGLAAYGLKAVDSYDTANNALRASVEASGESWSTVDKQVSKVDKTFHKYAYSSTQIRSALAGSIISTQSYKKSLDHLHIAMDLAAAKHIDLNTAMTTVDKAATGNMRALKQLGIDIAVPTSSAEKLSTASDGVTRAQQRVQAILSNFPNAAKVGAKGHAAYSKAVDATRAAEKKLQEMQGASKKILDTLSGRLRGQAAGSADTYAMKMKALKATFSDTALVVGQKLLPVVSWILTKFSAFIDYAKNHKWVLVAIGALVGTILVAAFVSWAVELWGTMSALFGVAASAIAASSSLGFAELAMVGLSAATTLFGLALKSTGVLLLIGLIIFALYELVTHWKTVMHFLSEVWSKYWGIMMIEIKAVWWVIDNVLVKPLMWIWDKVKGPIGKAFSWIGSAITGPFKAAMAAIKWLWNSTVGGFSFSIPSWIPFVGGKSFTIPMIGQASATGSSSITGVATHVAAGARPTTTAGAMVGASGLQGNGNNNIIIHVHGGDPQQVVQAVVAHARRNGSIPIKTSLNAAAA